MPAARSFLVLGLATLLLVASLLEAWLAWVALGLDALLTLAVLVDFRRARALPLTVVRRWPLLPVQGVEAGVELTLSGAGRNAAVRLREALHPGLAPMPLRLAATVPAEGAIRLSYRLTPRRRGGHLAGPLTARVLGPWGLAWAQRELLAAEPVRVYPQVRWEGKVGQLLALAQRQRLGLVPLRLHGVGTEMYAVRDYVPGDPLGKVHWKATARHGRLISREDTWERNARLVVVLDCARTMASVDGGRSKLDYAVAAALALTRVAASRGDQVTVVAVSDRIERSVRVRSGGRGVAEAYAALYDLDAKLVEPAHDLAAEAVFAVEPRRATTVLLTSVVDLAAAELLRGALVRLGRRHRTLLVNLEDPELGRLAAAEPATPAEAFAQVSALEIQLANRRLGRQLRRGGIHVVNTSADRLALATLEGYLAFYRGPGLAPRYFQSPAS
jgi:uncharacterized protein (DUF58 family)